jgi:hypothetical protein
MKRGYFQHVATTRQYGFDSNRDACHIERAYSYGTWSSRFVYVWAWCTPATASIVFAN